MGFDYRDEKYFSFADFCRCNDINICKVYHTIRKNNLPINDENKKLIVDIIFFDKEHENMVEYEGVKYKSFFDFCHKWGLNVIDAYNKVKDKEDLSELKPLLEAVKSVKVNKTRKNAIEYNGVSYPSLRSCVEALGLNYFHFSYMKYHHNLSAKEVLDQMTQEQITQDKEKKSKIIYKGKEYSCVYDLCKKNGIPQNFMTSQLLYYGKDTPLEEIIERYNHYYNEEITYNGIFYSSISDCLTALKIRKIDYSRFKNRYNISPTECIKTCLGGDSVTYEGITYATLKECCKANLIRFRVVLDFMYNEGVSPYKALILAKEKARNNREELGKASNRGTYNTGRVKFRGNWYKDTTELFNEYGVKRGSIYYFKKRYDCSTVLEALELYLTNRDR